MLLHAAYGVRGGVDKLEPLSQATTTAVPTPSPSPASEAPSVSAENRGYGLPILIVSGVLLLALIALWLSLRLGAKRKRR